MDKTMTFSNLAELETLAMGLTNLAIDIRQRGNPKAPIVLDAALFPRPKAMAKTKTGLSVQIK
jgi:hypothetical protein